MKQVILHLAVVLIWCQTGLSESILVVPTRIDGDVKVATKGTESYVAIDENTLISAGDTIRTGEDGDAAFRILPGARIQIPERTQLQISAVEAGQIERSASGFMPVASAVKSILTNNDYSITDAQARTTLSEGRIALFSGSVRAAVQRVNFRVSLPAGYLTASDATFAATVESFDCERISVSSGAVTLTAPDGKTTGVAAGTFVRLCRKGSAFEVSGPFQADLDSEAMGDLAVLRGYSDYGLEPVAEGKEMIDPKEELPPVGEFQPPLLQGLSSPIGFGFSAPFDLPPPYPAAP